MKRVVLIFGLISGVISAGLMLAFIPFIDKIGFDKGFVLGYSAIVLSMLLVFFGVRSYRENVGNGHISFLRAFSVGLLITLISCALYSVTWQIAYHAFLPDFFDKYTNYVVSKMKESGSSPQEVSAKLAEMKSLQALNNNPLVGFLLVFLEPLPVGLLVTLVSALILRRKNKAMSAEQLATSI